MPVNPAAALAIQVAKGILSMGWAFGSVGHVKQSHSGGPPPLTIKMSWPGVVNCQPECSQSGAIWDGLGEPGEPLDNPSGGQVGSELGLGAGDEQPFPRPRALPGGGEDRVDDLLGRREIL